MPETFDFDVFLSYHWRDHAQVESLAQRLRGAGLRVFLDRWYLIPGTNWLSALEKTLARCKSVAVCIGAEMGPWQQREQYSALERQVAEERRGVQFPVIPVLLLGAESPLGFLKQNTWVDLRAGPDDPIRFEVLTKAIRGEPPGPDAQSTVQQALSEVCPYRGLLYFREQDAEFFCGRKAATIQLVEAIAKHPLVAVVGASGSGKSSVVRAGLIPRLRESKSTIWEIVTLVPTDRPLHALAAALLPLLEPEMSEVTRLGEISLLAERFLNGAIALRDVVERVLAKQPGTERLMLVVDQWEELFTLTQDEGTRRRFIDGILQATDKSKLSVVLTLRGDYFGRAVTGQRELSDRLQGAQVNLGPMIQDELRQAMEEPARRVGLSFEPGLVDSILAAAGDEPGNLPLLEFVLRELWEQRQGGLMHKAAYEAMGKLQGAIAKKADALYGQLVAKDPQAAKRIQSVFLRLVRPGEGEQDTRRRASASEFDPSAVALIKQLSDERLLVTSKAGAGDAETVEVAHEALIQNWQKLRDWVGVDRQFMTWQQRLNTGALEWQARKRSADLLLRGLSLAEARDWQKKTPDRLSELECEFVNTSAKRKLIMRGAGTMLAVVVLATIGYFLLQTLEARKRADFARERAEDLVQFMVFDLRDKLAPIGRLELMDSVNARVNDYYEKIGAKDSSLGFERRRGASYNNQGDTLLARGKLDAARKAYEQGFAIAERLAEADPSNTGWQRDLSVGYERLGNVEVAAGNLDAARKGYEQSKAICEQLANADPSNSEWQRALCVSHIKLGDVERRAGNLDAARKAYEQSQGISERLAKGDPSNIGWQSVLSMSYERLGDVEMAAGEFDAARKAYEQSFVILDRLSDADPGNSGQQRDLAVSYYKRGDAELAAGKLDAARNAYEQSQVISERLAKADPSNSGWQRDLSVSYNALGNVEGSAGKLDAARRAYEQGSVITERLAKADPSNTEWQRDLWLSYLHVGEVEMVTGKLDEARKAFEQGVTILEPLANADPSNRQWQRDLSMSYMRIGYVLTQQNQREKALVSLQNSRAIIERLTKLDPSNAVWKNDLEWVNGRIAELKK